MPDQNNLVPLPQLGDRGNKIGVKAGDIDGTETLRQGQEIVVYEHQIGADKIGYWGHGAEQAPTGVGRIYADLVNQASQANISGDLVLRVTDSTGKTVLRTYELGDIGSLRDAASEDRTDRPALPNLGPPAGPHRKLQLAVRADSGSDGEQIDTGNSSMVLYRTVR
jgi:hypothetical protein